MRRAAPEMVLIAMPYYPLRAGEIGLPRDSGPFGLLGRVDMQHQARNLGPAGAVGFGLQQPHVGHEVLLVIAGQPVGVGRGVRQGRVRRRSLHQTFPPLAHNPTISSQPQWPLQSLRVAVAT